MSITYVCAKKTLKNTISETVNSQNIHFTQFPPASNKRRKSAHAWGRADFQPEKEPSWLSLMICYYIWSKYLFRKYTRVSPSIMLICRTLPCADIHHVGPQDDSTQTGRRQHSLACDDNNNHMILHSPERPGDETKTFLTDLKTE